MTKNNSEKNQEQKNKNSIEKKRLIEQIRDNLQDKEKDQIVIAMGYYSRKKGLKRLEGLLEMKSIEEWLKTGGYDFYFTNESFLIRLCEILKFDKDHYLKIIDDIKKILKDLGNMPQPYVFINTNFKRTTQPIFALAFMEGSRRIGVSKKLVYNSNDEGLSKVKQFIKDHYAEKKGILKMWGKIDNYIYHVNGKNLSLIRMVRSKKEKKTYVNQKQHCQSKIKNYFRDF